MQNTLFSLIYQVVQEGHILFSIETTEEDFHQTLGELTGSLFDRIQLDSVFEEEHSKEKVS